ncbi:MAG: histidine kinase, partial [Lachnospiraceae bacterium]|nr:histidine kinase [Lachnospiraceae bacterium]
MSDWSDYLQVSIISAALMLSMIVIWFGTAIPGMDRWSRHFFRSYFFVFILCCLSSLAEIAFYHYHAPSIAIYTIMIVESLFLSLPVPMLTVYLLHYCGESLWHSKLLKAVIVLMIIYLLVLAGAQIIGGSGMSRRTGSITAGLCIRFFYLCKQDPDLAQQVTLDFTTYLRKNLTAIASAETIPFSSELEHTHAYLAVEQALYKNTLLICYDTPHTFFRVPPLTLQPIVENAVKHGRDPYIGPLRISILTKKTDLGSEIIVEDSGRGFDPAGSTEPDLALSN